MTSRFLQRLERASETLVGKHPWVVLIVVGTFTLTVILTATTIWEAMEAFGIPWKWVPFRLL